MSKPLLELKNISIKYDDKIVVNDISITVQEGEIIGIVGESGSGKSTLIKSIIGILTAFQWGGSLELLIKIFPLKYQLNEIT